MSDHQMSAAEARRMLSQPDEAPDGWTRRRFLSAIGWGIGGGLLAGGLGDLIVAGLAPGDGSTAWATPPLAPSERIVIHIVMYGGNDGLNTVVPYTDGNYYDQRGSLAVAPANVLPLDDRFGLNPELTYLAEQWAAGRLAVVHGIGYPNPDLSHFTSMAIWMSARVGLPPTSGWIGRWLDLQSTGADEVRAVTIGTSVPLHLVGESRRASAVPPWGMDFGGGSEAADLRMYQGLRQMSSSLAGRGPWHDSIATTIRRQLDLADMVSPVFSEELPDSEIVRKLVVAARLVNADLGLRVVDVGWGDFDSHANQPWMHSERLRELNTGLSQFFAALDPVWHDRVTVMTVSEFGRTPYANDSAGTDHGTASCQFLIGAGVRGGMYGQAPSLAGLARWERPAHHVDLRSFYATVLGGCLGGGASEVLGGSFDVLGCFE